MRAKILNRGGDIPADHWYHIEVSGTHPAGPGRRQLIDEKAVTSIVNRFNGEKAAAGDNFGGMLVDLDHRSHDLTQTTEAHAWLQDVEARAGQLWGRLDLTDLGEHAIRNKRVKWFSTEYDPEDVEPAGDGVVRPLRLSGLAFTNRPNNRGGKPISNRDGDVPDGEQTETETTMQPIALKLGLPADADEAAILTKITSLMSELEAAKGKEAGAEADAIMNRLGSRVPESVRPMWREKLITNRQETEKLMEASFPGTQARKAEDKIFNRADAKQPATVTDGDAAEAGQAKKAAAIRNRANSIANEQGIPFNRAFGLAQAELS
jgi:hypothetical protein